MYGQVVVIRRRALLNTSRERSLKASSLLWTCCALTTVLREAGSRKAAVCFLLFSDQQSIEPHTEARIGTSVVVWKSTCAGGVTVWEKRHSCVDDNVKILGDSHWLLNVSSRIGM